MIVRWYVESWSYTVSQDLLLSVTIVNFSKIVYYTWSYSFYDLKGNLEYSNGYEDQGRYEEDRYSESEEDPSQYEDEASQTEEDEPPGRYTEDDQTDDELPGQYDNYSDEEEDYEEHRRHEEGHFDEEPPMVFHGSVRSPPRNGHDGRVEAVRESPAKTIQPPEDIPEDMYNKDEITDEANDAGPVEDFSEDCSVTLSQATGCEISELASDSEFSEMGKV